jgi:hypothetical protein
MSPADAQPDPLTRRMLLGRGLGASATLAGSLLGAGTADAARHRARQRHHRPHAVGLPSPAQVRRDFTRMVEFGPRLTGSPSHEDYIGWLEHEYVRAGLELHAPDSYRTDRWTAGQAALAVAGAAAPVAAYYPRAQGTPGAGVAGPLVYGGTAPVPSLNGTDLGALQAALKRYPAELASWTMGLSGTLQGGTSGSILLVDLPMPVPLLADAFLPIATYLSWPGHSLADWVTSDYKRLWVLPGLALPLQPFAELGARGVVFVVDASSAALKGGYLPFLASPQPLPALYVDRDTGARLRAQAAARPQARLTLPQSRATVPTRTVTAVLPGRSAETLIFNTHSDGQGFAEENAGVAFVQLARHFASLPAWRRPRRTLVFATWPGHMTYDLPQTQGWIDAHPDLVKRAAAALTVEHLGCSEWLDTPDRGYHATGRPEMYGVWTTQGTMFELVRDATARHALPRTALLRPPAQFGVGAAFQSSGVPQIGAIAGPEYLVTVSDNGDLDKLDEHLAARQIAWVADVATRVDAVPAATLRQGDPTLPPKS